jgi:hypothetical protein
LGRDDVGITTFILGTIIAAHFWLPARGSLALAASPTVTLVAFGVACGFVILMAGARDAARA